MTTLPRCATCGHLALRHLASAGACRVGWTYLHYAEKRCQCAAFVEPPADSSRTRGGAT